MRINSKNSDSPLSLEVVERDDDDDDHDDDNADSDALWGVEIIERYVPHKHGQSSDDE